MTTDGTSLENEQNAAELGVEVPADVEMSADGVTSAPAVSSEEVAISASTQEAATNIDDAEPAKTGQESGSASLNSKERDQIFDVYQNALENVDWGYKLKSGEERDVGHKSMVIAERAFIAAYALDSAGAEKIYEQHAGRPPKEELLKRAQAFQAAGNEPGKEGVSISDLTAGITNLGERRDHIKNQGVKDEIEKKMGNWRIALGDTDARSRSHMKVANDLLLKQEKPRDDGMHILAAFRSGMRAADEYGEMWEQRRRRRELLTTVREHQGTHKEVSDKIAQFEKKSGVQMGDTTGPNGQTVARFQRAFGVVKSALAKEPSVGSRGAGVADTLAKTPPSGVQRAAAAMMQNAGISR